MQKQSIVIEPHETIKEFRLYLYERENAKATIDKYLTDVNTFYKFLNHNCTKSLARWLALRTIQSLLFSNKSSSFFVYVILLNYP